MMAVESPGKKFTMATGYFITFVATAILGGIYLAWMVNVNKIQTEYDTSCETRTGCPEVILYDVIFSLGSSSDSEKARQYMEDLDAAGCDGDCFKQGSRWSIIYTFCGITLILIAVNSLLLAFGAWNFHSRMIGGCCGFCLACVNFAAIIVTGVFRFNTMGKWSAISLVGSKYSG